MAARPNGNRNARAFAAKLREYRAFLRNDEDWDWAYILRLLQFKLARTRKCILTNDLVVSAPKIGRQIEQVERLLERVVEDRYFEELAKPFHKKYGRLQMKISNKKRDSRATEVTFRFTRETPRNRNQANREWTTLRRKADRMQKSDLRKAFALMHNNIWGWWD